MDGTLAPGAGGCALRDCKGKGLRDRRGSSARHRENAPGVALEAVSDVTIRVEVEDALARVFSG